MFIFIYLFVSTREHMGSSLQHVVVFFLADACRIFFFSVVVCWIQFPDQNQTWTRVQSFNQWTIRKVPIAFLDNCGYSSLIVLHSSTADSFLQFSCIVESESTSVISYCYIKIHCLYLHFQWIFNYFDLGRKTFSFYPSRFSF